MMSNFKYCPMCGTQRDDDSRFCKNCNFEFLVGNYVKKSHLKFKKFPLKRSLKKSLWNQMIF